MDAKELLEIHLNQRGSETALVGSLGQPVCWSQFGDLVQARMLEFANDDLNKPFIYRSRNTIEDVVTAIAIACHGGIDAPLDDRLSRSEFDRRVELLKSTSQPHVGPSLRDGHYLRSSPSSLGEARLRENGTTILWTSGTTSQPMGVIQTHEAWLNNAAAKLKAVPQGPDDARLTVLPLSHSYARTCDLGTWLLSGSTLAVALGMEGLLRWAPKAKPTLMNVVPSMAYQLLEKEVPGLERLRLLGVGGAALSDEAFATWKRRGVTVIQGYGLTETGPVIASATPKDATAGLVGDFVDGWQHEIRDGVLWVRGPSLMQGYWQDSEATDERIDVEGWLNTNDQVEVDPKTGQLRILGRSDDIIVLDNAVKIHPAEFERAAQQVIGVRHAMLTLRDQLELWIDGELASESSLRTLLLQHHWGHQTQIRFLNHPLTIEAGELTSKLTIRRDRLVDRRQAENK